jgi:hypothetical protein
MEAHLCSAGAEDGAGPGPAGGSASLARRHRGAQHAGCRLRRVLRRSCARLLCRVCLKCVLRAPAGQAEEHLRRERGRLTWQGAGPELAGLGAHQSRTAQPPRTWLCGSAVGRARAGSEASQTCEAEADRSTRPLDKTARDKGADSAEDGGEALPKQRLFGAHTLLTPGTLDKESAASHIALSPSPVTRSSMGCFSSCTGTEFRLSEAAKDERQICAFPLPAAPWQPLWMKELLERRRCPSTQQERA